MTFGGKLTRTQLKHFVAVLSMSAGMAVRRLKLFTAALAVFSVTLTWINVRMLIAKLSPFGAVLSRTTLRQLVASLQTFTGVFTSFRLLPKIVRAFAALIWPEDNNAVLVQPGDYAASEVQ